MSVKNKQNSSVNSLVRAELVTASPTARPTARLTPRPPLVITIPHSLYG